jgi:hypothetical protein
VFLTKSYYVAVGDDAGREVEEGFVDVVASFQRMRRRFMPWYQAMVLSITHRWTPRPEPCARPGRRRSRPKARAGEVVCQLR